MNRQVIVRPEAKRDVQTAKTWYGRISAELEAEFPQYRRDRALRGAQTTDRLTDALVSD